MRIVVAGSSGFLGSNLVTHLRGGGHRVTTLVRRPPGDQEIRWDPASGHLDPAALEGADVVVNLAGSPLLGNPRSARHAREMRESRIGTTTVLAEAIAAQDRPPAFLAGNGISVYGDHGAEVLTEDADMRGDARMAVLAREWEAATQVAAQAGSRVCVLRTAPVLDLEYGPLKMLVPLFRLGLGARLGSGSQFFPVISVRDWVAAVSFLAESRDVQGPFNLCSPMTPTNAQFTKALARAVHRPAFLAAPAPILKAAAGPMAPELLGSLNTRPAALERAGFDFRDLDVDDVVAAGLSRLR